MCLHLAHHRSVLGGEVLAKELSKEVVAYTGGGLGRQSKELAGLEAKEEREASAAVRFGVEVPATGPLPH